MQGKSCFNFKEIDVELNNLITSDMEGKKMIVRETKEGYILVKQHDHAHLSGQLADHWKEEFFKGKDKKEEVLYAVYQHDRGWISLDESPFWNDRDDVPYSFMDFPLVPKLVHYEFGIDKVKENNSYAALLCSLHYTALLYSASADKAGNYLSHEKQRQRKLKEQLHIHSTEKEEQLTYHFHLLQFFDRLSLYLCINEPGVRKSGEFQKYKDGFKNSEYFYFTNGSKIKAEWLDTNHVSVHPFPFEKEFKVTFRYKEVTKAAIKQFGIIKAYKNTEFKEQGTIIAEK
jgi:hypothetical protein